MGNILFQHNRNAYEAVVSMLEETGRAAIIHPTGTGKSFIAFQLCAEVAEQGVYNEGRKPADNAGHTVHAIPAGCRVCWLSPSEYIFMTQLEKWRAAGGVELDNIQFLTYARLMRLSKDALAELKPDYIILDEFHRCGAAQWGGGVERLREMYPQAKVLGLSATNIRYLDNQRDMAWELFGGNVASELTLGAAIAQGILPAPKYVLSIYSYRRELRRYEARVRQARNRAVRDAAEKELEALRRALEKADGLAEVFARHMAAYPAMDGEDIDTVGRKSAVFLDRTGKQPDRIRNQSDGTLEQPNGCGRYIVFCADYEHLLQMRELAPEWFAKVDPAPHIYTAYSDDPETSAEFAAFKADTSGHLKLLYCIDMLNEGIHVDGLSGVILLRPTVSPTIYKQQIGRALAAGAEKIPVIFDIVMNIENLCSIGAIEEELREAVFAFRTNGKGEEIVQEHFRIIDELGDCRRLFAQLNETLSASWDAMYAIAKEYYAEHGNLEIPVKYATADGYSLGAWIATQRKVYTGKTAGCLSEKQIRQLEEIGMRWQGTQEAAWERNFSEAEKYFKEQGNLDVPADYVTESGCRLGRWVRWQREKYQKAAQQVLAGMGRNEENIGQGNDKKKDRKPDVERIQRLSGIGMTWENDDPWERRFLLAKKYYEEHGNLEIPTDYVVEGIWLGRWLWEQKSRFNGGGQAKQLSEDQKQRLCAIGFVPGMSKTEITWREQYRQAEEFYSRHGNLSIPKHYTAKNGKKLGVWLQHQRANRRSGNLAGWQVRMLDGIGMAWEMDSPWENGLRHAKAYFRQYGNLAVPNQYVCADGYRLGRWISNQRCAHAGVLGKGLGEEQTRQLEELGMVWSMRRGRQCRKGLVTCKKT
ncbi:MAG: Helicase associated domain protein [Lachnospiraceae bacterium]|nr:Helicase associated domain protein [Lachnospiraceae bacterium]